MSERYRLTASFVAPEAARRGPAGAIARTDLLASVLGTLHPAALVERARVSPEVGGVATVVVTLALAGQGEADDSVARVVNATGLPPVDAVKARHLGEIR